MGVDPEGELVTSVAEAARADAASTDRAQRVADLVRAGTRRRWVGVYEVARGRVRNLAWSGVGPPAHPTFAVGSGLTGAAIEAGETVLSNDVAADARYLTNQDSTGSELIAPVVDNGRVVGTLDVEDSSTEAFGPRDVELFSGLAAAIVDLYR
jgi:putative methionine-R-sulfoxide reductase with GAF domain